MNGNNPVEMEIYSLKTNKTFSNEKLDVKHMDDSIHSGRCICMYIQLTSCRITYIYMHVYAYIYT
jgi:hypothetical protein